MTHAEYMRRWRAANPDRVRVIRAREQARRLRLRRAVGRLARLRGCLICGLKGAPSCVYDWHHHRGQKAFSIGAAAGSSRARLRAELAKCCVLCCFCHRLLHAGIVSLDQEPLIT